MNRVQPILLNCSLIKSNQLNEITKFKNYKQNNLHNKLYPTLSNTSTLSIPSTHCCQQHTNNSEENDKIKFICDYCTSLNNKLKRLEYPVLSNLSPTTITSSDNKGFFF